MSLDIESVKTSSGGIDIGKLDEFLQQQPRYDHRVVVVTLSSLYRRRTMLAREERAKAAHRPRWIPGKGYERPE